MRPELLLLFTCLIALFVVPTQALSSEELAEQWERLTPKQRHSVLTSVPQDHAIELYDALPPAAKMDVIALDNFAGGDVSDDEELSDTDLEVGSSDEDQVVAAEGNLSDANDPTAEESILDRKSVTEFLIDQKQPDRFSFPTAKKMVAFALAAYCFPYKQERWECSWCKKTGEDLLVSSAFEIAETNTGAYVGWNKQCSQCRIYAGFRGTRADSMKNWWTNLKAAMTANWVGFNGISVHTGFAGAYAGARSTFRSGIHDSYEMARSKCGAQRAAQCKVYITGHSLGGGLATLGALDVAKNPPHGALVKEQVTLFTYGAPRVGNKKFAMMFNKLMWGRSWRFSNYKDIVTHVPPYIVGYRHVATEVWHPFRDGEGGASGNDWKQCATTNEDQENSKCGYQYTVSLSISDHSHYLGYIMDKGDASCDFSEDPAARKANWDGKPSREYLAKLKQGIKHKGGQAGALAMTRAAGDSGMEQGDG